MITLGEGRASAGGHHLQGGDRTRAGPRPGLLRHRGDGLGLCSGDMLLEALGRLAGITLKAVATALDLPLKGRHGGAEGDLDFRAHLRHRSEAQSLRAIRLSFDLDCHGQPGAVGDRS